MCLPTATCLPQHLSYSPYGLVYLREGRVTEQPFVPPPRLPPLPGSNRSVSWSVLMRADGELRQLPDGSESRGGCRRPGGIAQGAAGAWPAALLCCCAAAKCQRAPSPAPPAGSFIAAPHIFLPGTTVSAVTIEPTLEACAKRCKDHPDCKCAPLPGAAAPGGLLPLLGCLPA